MNDHTNVFITESNVDLVLSKGYEAMEPRQRDTLLRLVIEEEARMGSRREHVENGQRRLDDCSQRVRNQRELVSALRRQERDVGEAEFILETFERTLKILEDHQKRLVKRFHVARF